MFVNGRNGDWDIVSLEKEIPLLILLGCTIFVDLI